MQDRRKIERSKAFNDPVIHMFASLMEGATMQDWLSLFDFQSTRKHIYYYNQTTRCVDQPCQSVAPWPVIWILARFHPRHIGVADLCRTWTSFKLLSTFFCEQNSLAMVFSRHTETAVFYLCPIPRQIQSVHSSCSPFSRHVDLEFETLPHRSFYQEFTRRLP